MVTKIFSYVEDPQLMSCGIDMIMEITARPRWIADGTGSSKKWFGEVVSLSRLTEWLG
jgi:hypothetical protein